MQTWHLGLYNVQSRKSEVPACGRQALAALRLCKPYFFYSRKDAETQRNKKVFH